MASILFQHGQPNVKITTNWKEATEENNANSGKISKYFAMLDYSSEPKQ